jgi:hypothetical protein
MTDEVLIKAFEGFERKLGAVEGARADIETADGTRRPLLKDEFYKQRMAELTAEADGAHAEFTAALDARESDIRRELELAEAERLVVDGLKNLKPDELALASNRAQFVKDDTEKLDLEILTARAKIALDKNDRVETALLARFLPARLDAERAGGNRTVGTSDLAKLVTQMRGTFVNRYAEAHAASLRAAAADVHTMRLQAEQRVSDFVGRPSTIAQRFGINTPQKA